MRLALVLVVCAIAAPARADIGLNIYGLSWHLNSDKAHETGTDNWFNPGLGARYRIPGERLDLFFDAGAYRDSGRNTAVFAGGGVHWRATQRGRLGLALVLFNSQTYNEGRSFVAPLPVAAWELGSVTLNLLFSPKIKEINDVNTLGFWVTYWLR